MKTDRDSNIELMLLNITGNDRPGVTVELSEILDRKSTRLNSSH